MLAPGKQRALGIPPTPDPPGGEGIPDMFQLTLFRKSISYCGADPLSDGALLTASIAHQ